MFATLRTAIRVLALILAVAICRGMPTADAATPADTARQILDASGVRGGLVVHLGCADGRLTAALGAGEKYTVQGLDAEPVNVEAARRYVAEQSVYGPVSVDLLSNSTLPYANNLINLIVVERPGQVSREEVLRVLAPGGVAYVKGAEGWRKSVKPVPDDIDEWTHFLHDAGNNAVANDRQVGPPRSLQWIAPPLWLRSHETPSGIEALVSSGGRLFYFFDEGPVGITDQRLPERWSIICRDAYNGKLLWKRPVQSWGWPEWAEKRFKDIDWTEIRGGRTVVPNENQRRLVAEGDRLYATLGYRGPLSILDAATGEVLSTVKETAPANNILAAEGVVLVLSRPEASSAAKRRGERKKVPSRLIAVSGDSGKVLWRKDVENVQSLFLAIDAGRVFYLMNKYLVALNLSDGEQLWQAETSTKRRRTLVVHDGVTLVYAGNTLEARDATDGRLLWRNEEVPPSNGGESVDLFVVDGVVWRGMVAIDEELKPITKSEDAMAVGYDLRTGEQKRQIVVRRLRSPEHHHRCYRNKATERYIISGMEGAEFMDLEGDNHSQDNWLRGACKLGIMPANGLLYMPSDQCFCQPGSKLLGFAAVAAQRPRRAKPLPDDQRLTKGPAYSSPTSDLRPPTSADWPTFRHDPARHGSTKSAVSPNVKRAWRTKLGGKLTAPVAVGDQVYVAQADAHTVHALDAATGKPVWQYVAGGRVDSPPTIHKGRVLFGSADGNVYCLDAADGRLAWRFLAAPRDVRIGYFDQIESVWPVHGSVLVSDGVAYVAAGRSTYLDGGIRVYALDPSTGKLLRKTTLEGPFPNREKNRDFAFYLMGANSDVLVAEGGHIFMRQKQLTPQLEEVHGPVLSTKGELNTGLHVFSTSGLLDDSWYNRTFWMYSKRWPGFQLANQAPKSGQLLVVDDERTYALRVFYRRNCHSLMFFPAKEGYLLFADANGNEPQIVGEPGARKPLEWLPQSHIPRKGNPGIDAPSFGVDKWIGYTRAELPLWKTWVPIRVWAMVKTADVLFVAGQPDVLDPKDPLAALEGRKGARLAALSAADGKQLTDQPLDTPPVFDGLIAARGRLFISLSDGTIACFSP